MSHTPGPWEVEMDASGPIFVRESAGHKGRVARIWMGRTCEESNADLIAASPDLLEALQNIAYWYSRIAPPPYGHKCQWCEACVNKAKDAVRAAIAKATGGAL